MTPNVFIDKDPDHLHRFSQWSDWSVTVAGIGIAGFACADALMQLGARVTVVDAGDGERQRERAEILDVIGVHASFSGTRAAAPAGTDLLVVSPGLRPSAPIIVDALERGIPVWGELELAWRLRHPDTRCRLAVRHGHQRQDDHHPDARVDPARCGLPHRGGRQHRALAGRRRDARRPRRDRHRGRCAAAAVRPHDEPGGARCASTSPTTTSTTSARMEAYVAAKARIYERTQEAAVYNVQDDVTLRMVEEADVVEGCRAIGFTLGAPALSMLGVVDDLLVDRAFVAGPRASRRRSSAPSHDVHPLAPHNVANALAAAALARAFGVPPDRRARRTARVHARRAPHRDRRHGGRRHLRRRLEGDERARGADVAVRLRAHRVDRGRHGEGAGVRRPRACRRARACGASCCSAWTAAVIAEALARHAPDVPVIDVDSPETGAMVEVVQHAASLAQPGDTVLLAPGCASWDMFRDYTDRGQPVRRGGRRHCRASPPPAEPPHERDVRADRGRAGRSRRRPGAWPCCSTTR